jgi:hypothetical protein
MVKSLKSEDVDAEVPTKVMKTDIDTMNTPMASSITIEESGQRTSLGKLCCGMLLSFLLRARLINTSNPYCTIIYELESSS